MRVWITGADGMVGSQLLERCQNLGLVCLATGKAEADVTDRQMLGACAEQFAPTHIISCAAYTDVDGAEKNPARAFAVNADGAQYLAEVAHACGAKLIHLSTDYVFDGKSSVPYGETASCCPLNVYGMSKWEGEKRVFAVLPDACVIRTSWVFGRKGKNFISSLIQWMQEKEVIRVVSDQYSSPTYCGDLVDAVLALLDQKGVFHFANRGSASRYEMALEVYKEAGASGIAMKCQKIEPVASDFFPTIAERPAYSALCTDKIATYLQPRPWTETLRDYFDYAR